MNPRLDAWIQILRLNNRLFENCFDGVDDELSLRRINPDTNHMNFLGLHLVEARFWLLGQLGQDLSSPFHDLVEGVRGIDEVSSFPPIESLLQAWRRSGEALEEALRPMTDQQLDAEFSETVPAADKTVLAGITFLLHHEATHIGQLALLRKAHGLPAMAYSAG